MTNNRRITKNTGLLKESYFDEFIKDVADSLKYGVPKVGESSHPRVNITALAEVDGGQQYTVEFALAGYKRESISSFVEKVPNNGNTYKVLTVVAEPPAEDTTSYVTKEISKRKASRKVFLGVNDEIKEARYEDGILYITVFRESKSEQRQVIDIL